MGCERKPGFGASIVVLCCCAAAGAQAGDLDSERRLGVAIVGPDRGTLHSGRVVLYLEEKKPTFRETRDPASGPHLRDPQPIIAMDVEDLDAGDVVYFRSDSASFPGAVDEIPPGRYRARCVLDRYRLDSDWRREPGNLYSDVVMIDVEKPGVMRGPALIALKNRVEPEPVIGGRGVEMIEFRSELLSAFRGSDVSLRALVIHPLEGAAYGGRSYPALYVIPGFGGNHRSGVDLARRWHGEPPRLKDQEAVLAQNAFVIYLDPEGPNGHHLFANSANNGPVEDALIHELIPELERRFPLAARPEGRMVSGHSSGGWSALWLSLRHPDVFGACWSSAPDPVDFRRFQLGNIYTARSMYADADGNEVRSARFSDGPGVSVRDENHMEEVIGPGGTSAQAWDAWQAVFGPREGGRVVPLFDWETGGIDAGVAESWRAYDIGALVRSEPDRYIPLLRERVRLIVGDEDSFFLDGAVVLLRDDIAETRPRVTMDVPPGSIRVLAGHDHRSIKTSAERARWPGEMVRHLRRGGFISD